MTTKEFEDMKLKFYKEQARWESLKVGDPVYETGWDTDVFEIIIDQINVSERYIIGRDMSQNEKVVRLTGGFYTRTELEARYI